jgi:hypothetical protein
MRSKILFAALAATLPRLAGDGSDCRYRNGASPRSRPPSADDQRGRPLNFGTVLASAVAGTVTIDADTGARSFTGGVTGIALDLGNRGLFDGLGTENQQVEITLNPVAVLTGPGPDITVVSMELDSCACLIETRTIPVGGGGAFQVGVGGEFAIAASQTNGLYTGNYSVTAEYQ